MLFYGVTVEYWTSDGNVSGVPAQVVDFDNPSNNDWLAVNQFSVTENPNTRRPDVLLFVNGLPLGTIELKNPVDEDATVCTAWNQLQTYKSELPALFSMNERWWSPLAWTPALAPSLPERSGSSPGAPSEARRPKMVV